MDKELTLESAVRDLTLILLFLTSWIEGKPPYIARRSWKGYPFKTLDQLVEKGLLDGSHGAKSVWFTEAGEKEARILLARYGLENLMAMIDMPSGDEK